MNRYLLDSQILIWWINEAEKLPQSICQLIENKQNTIFISVATIWEIGIKQSLGKLYVSDHLLEDIAKLGFTILNISAQHADYAAKLPLHHRDPFDRMLIAQASIEQIPILSADQLFTLYKPFPFIQV
ncbi:type II toxin-antitoxin system VapC family toxin [Acinetobacter sp. NIPH 2699]|uniref:type II toxin-antitoxin system VapC family toxin n=1 Tax=Acinetobacter sp. NIPH 2699 TaxID=2923433 RepID=UPI001F4B9D02|nr:type II toxin-antitoxin system VapC family toxin [Acinetobacter sp. NIPH 2699]MCH7336727.1 type II toxin-antitoxin system VapC family toxin [Acinetobacter sp. NIPH 2699]